MHKKTVAKFRRLKIVLALLALVAAFSMFDLQSQRVYADDVSSMEDISQHYSNAGGTWAASDKAGDYNEIDGVGKNWNYFGNGQSTPILTNGARGTKTSTYDALATLGHDGSKGKGSLATAARFAYAMQQSGLDHPTNGGTSPMTSGGRIVGGWTTGTLLSAAGVAQACLTVAFKFFNWLNPFYALQFMVLNKGDSFTNSFFAPLISTLKPLYQSLNDMTMSVGILAFGIGILLVLMGFVPKGSQNGSLGAGIASKIMHLFIRILVMVGAPIFIGALAASLTQELETKTNVVQNIAMAQIYGNYVDFEGWAQNSRLALPDPGKSSSNKLMQSGNSAFTPEYIQQINAYGAQNSQAKNSLTDKENKQSTKAEFKQTWSSIGTTFGWLTNNYAHGSSINGTDWESYFRSHLITKERKYGIYKDDVKKNPFKPISDDGHYGSKFGHYGNADGYAGGAECVFFKDFTMNYSSKNGYYSDAPGKSAAKIGSPTGAGLSSIGLYNYLNVNATASGITYTQPKTFFGWGQINQHASSGFAGKGILFIGTYARMVAMMATVVGVVLFVLAVIWKGILQGSTRILLYLGQVGVGSPRGFMGVLKECIGMYARMAIGLLLVYFAQESLSTLANRMEDALSKGLNSAIIAMPTGNVQLFPFASTSWIMGIVRMFEAAGVVLFLYTMGRTYWDLLHAIDSLIQKIMDLLGKTQLGRTMLPTPKANASGMNSNNSAMNNANANSNDRKDANSNDANNSSDDSLDNNPQDLWKRHNDPNSNLGEDDGKGPHGVIAGLKSGMKSGVAASALDALHRGADSKAGKALTKGAGRILGTLGTTKLGHALGIKSRAQGMNLPGDAIAKAKQTQAEKVDPLHANTSKRAGLSKEHQKKLDTDESHAEQKAPDRAMQGLRKQYHQAKRLANMTKGKNSQVQDPANANALVNGLRQFHKSAGTTNSQGYKKLDHANKAFNKAAKSEQMQRRDQADQAKGLALENRKQAANAKLAMDSATTPQARQKAQKRYNDLKAKQPMLDQNAKKANVLADANKQAMFMQMTHRQVGAHGEGLRALSASQLEKAKGRQFTAMTGMSAKTATQADAATMNQARTARDNALATLTKDPSEVTDKEREQAEKTLGEANTVLQTGKQYGQFASKDAAGNLAAASQDEIAQAAHYNTLDKAAVATGFTAASNAEETLPSQKEFANRVTNAQQIVSTGMTTDEYGQQIEATPEQIQQAAKTLSTSPAHQIRTIQNQMMATSTGVQQGAMQYANHVATNAPKNATSAELQQIKQQAMDSYYQRPAVQKQLASAGLISGTTAKATPEQAKQIRQEIGNVQSLGAETQAGITASLAPIRQQLNQGGIDMPSQDICKDAARTAYNKLPARSDWVDAAHYNKTTRRDVDLTTNELLRAYKSNDQGLIKTARRHAVSKGMNMAYVSSPQQLQKLSQQIQSGRDNTVQVAMQHYSPNRPMSERQYQNYSNS